MKIIHLNGFSPEERQEFKKTVYSNIMQSMQTLVREAGRLGYDIQAQVYYMSPLTI